jgi:hypothetical protein
LLGGLLGADATKFSLVAKLQSLRQNWDAVNNRWNQWVLNYTPETQQSFIRSLGFNEVNWRTLTALMFGAGAVVMAIIALPLLRNRPRLDPLEAVYQKLDQQMARHGFPRSIYEGPRAYGNRLTAAESRLKPETKAAVSRFLALYESARYGAAEKTKNQALNKAQAAALIFKLKTLLAECR